MEILKAKFSRFVNMQSGIYRYLISKSRSPVSLGTIENCDNKHPTST